MCNTGFCDDPPETTLVEVRSIFDGQLLSTEMLPRYRALQALDAKVKEYLNAPVSMSGTSVQVVESDERIVYEQHID